MNGEDTDRPAMNRIENCEVAEKFRSYPEDIRKKLLVLRRLILDTAARTQDAGAVEETLKWGEPAYLARHGSTVRLGWKESNPDQYAICFHCRTSLVETFREIHGDRFRFEGNRALVFEISDEIPVNELEHCIALSLTYHRLKHLPLLGA